MRLLSLIAALLMSGCAVATIKLDGDTAKDHDLDGDGFEASDDCDDSRSSVNPGATEICGDAIDQDCDGVDASCPDMDGDGFSAEDGDCDDSDPTLTPEDADGDGVTSCDGDCDDADASYHPGADELDCSDPNDYNCDGSVAYADADADGWVACEECDDLDGTVHPGATETWYDGTDSDCSGGSDYDADGDGYDSANFGADDCDDRSSDSHPGAAETCDDEDNDCNGLIDDGVGIDWYVDNDDDGYGDAASSAVVVCDAPAGYVGNALDCDDASAAVSPIAAEACNGVDDDCDGVVPSDEVDADGDLSFACDDCDDADETISPLAEEVCGNGIDDDCDPTNDASGDTYYADSDGDGYGDASDSVTQCGAPADYVTNPNDCDDAAAGTNPGAPEVCDGSVDEDCDGTVDEGVTTRYYADADGDTWGSPGTWAEACSAPAGYVTDNSDCDDADAAANNDDLDADGDSTCDEDCDDTDADLNRDDMDGDGYDSCEGECNDSERDIHPGATEVCDGADNDCDGSADDGLSFRTYYRDGDSDDYGDAGTTISSCEQPAAYVEDDTDCNDADYTVYPGATETCDGADENCDGLVDETFDADADGAYEGAACSYGTDCDDADASVYPGAAEACDGIDNDCDALVDEDFDADGDGYASAAACAWGEDCDDADFAVSPAGKEISLAGTSIVDQCSDGIDNDCDGLADAADPWDCADEDGDGIENGIDVLVAWDLDFDGDDDAICVVSDLAMDAPWSGYDAILQGDGWGTFTSLDTSLAVPLVPYADSTGDGVDDVNAWCAEFSGASGSSGWNWRLVSAYAEDEIAAAPSSCVTASASTTWVVMDIADFCTATSDDWCRTGYASTDGCGDRVGTVVRVDYDASTNSIEPH